MILLACQKGAFLSVPAATVQGAERFAIVPHGPFWWPVAVPVGLPPRNWQTSFHRGGRRFACHPDRAGDLVMPPRRDDRQHGIVHGEVQDSEDTATVRRQVPRAGRSSSSAARDG